MSDYTPNLREIACVLRHKAHLAYDNNEGPCVYCGGNVGELGHNGEPSVVVWRNLNEACYIIPDDGTGMDLGAIGKSVHEYYETVISD